MAFAAVGAVLAGTATVGTTMAAVATVGATLGVVGAVTGSKDLQKIGGVLGLVGGVGSLAAGAFGAAGAAGAAGETAADTIAQGVAGAAADGAAGYATMGYEGAAALGSEAFGGIGQAMSAPIVAPTQGMPSTVDTRSVQGVDLTQGQPSINPAPSQPATQPPLDTGRSPVLDQFSPLGGDKPNDLLSQPVGQSLDPNRGYMPPDKVPSSDTFSGFDKLMNWMEKNPQLSGHIMTIGGNMLSKAFTPDYNEELLDLKRRQLDMQADSARGAGAGRIGGGGYYKGIVNGARQ